ncbi:hypothetical protein ACP275_10G182100 [Erythranthe tilingii]
MEEPLEYSKHFSHEHSLEYVKSSYDGDCICSGCEITITPNKFFYHCRDCKFSLHRVCYGMPKKFMHPADPHHHLTLLSPSSLTDQSNECGACGRCINGGFYYTCRKCCIYFHMLCVAMPLSVKIPISHPHVLKLEMKPPYGFKCGLCDRGSCSGWLYRCRLCEFDAHVSCAVTYNKNDSMGDDKYSHQYELMELLSHGMKGIVVNEEKVLDQELIQQSDQSILISENFTLPSYNFSDACFSIDIVKPIAVEGKTNESFNYRVKQYINENFDALDASNDGMKSKDQTAEIENVNSRRPFWFKLFVCS